MKTRYKEKIETICMNRKQFDECIKKIVNEKEQTILDEVYLNVEAQTISVCMCILEQSFNFDENEIHKYATEVKNLVNLMQSGIIGKQFGTKECYDHIKNKYNIDTFKLLGDERIERRNGNL